MPCKNVGHSNVGALKLLVSWFAIELKTSGQVPPVRRKVKRHCSQPGRNLAKQTTLSVQEQFNFVGRMHLTINT